MRHNLSINEVKHLCVSSIQFSTSPQKSVIYFLHFLTPAQYKKNGIWTDIEPKTCIFVDKFDSSLWRYKGNCLYDKATIEGDLLNLLTTYSIALNTFYQFKNSSFITSIMNELEKEFYSKDNYYNTIINCKLLELIAKIARGNSVTSYVLPENLVKDFENLRMSIYSHLSYDWTIEKMSLELGYSKSRFSVLYKAIFGISPTQDLIDARMAYAKTLLTQKKLRIHEVASMVGYNSENHFTRQFKRIVGISPSSYNK